MKQVNMSKVQGLYSFVYQICLVNEIKLLSNKGLAVRSRHKFTIFPNKVYFKIS